MPFMDHLKEAITSTQKPAKLNKPHFYKADSDARNQLEQLKEFLKTAPNNIKQQVEQDIKMLSYGISGEEQVAFELNNSYIPMIVLHDLNLEYDGLSAQIDYLILTRKVAFILECKNLIGDIEVNSNGDFIRTVEFNGRYKKEGIYSPITQNKRHLEMIKKLRFTTKTNIFSKTLFEKFFDENYKSVVVLANPKTVVNMKYAKTEIKEQIIRCDQLIDYIKRINDKTDKVSYKDDELYELADFFLNFHVPKTTDYTQKYLAYSDPSPDSLTPSSDPAPVNIEETPLYKALRQFRYEKSVAENVKPYFIYNNAQMEGLISAMPKTLEEMKKVSGFGDVKCQKYGEDLLEIIRKYG